MEPIAVKCDECNGLGYVNGEQCWKCDGNARVMIGQAIEPKKASRGARMIACIAFVILCFLGAYLIGHGGK